MLGCVRSWLAILVTIGASAGCNDHGAGALTEVKAKVCACKTASCAEQELQRVSQHQIDSNHRTQTIAREMLECVAKLQDAERPSTDPDEHGEDGEPGAVKTVPGVAAPAAQAKP